MKNLNSIKFIVFITICISCPRRLSAQEVSWTSSNPELVSVDANGTIKYEQVSTSVQYITITQTATQNGKSITSVRTVEANPYYPNCNSPSVYINGTWWAGCNVGSSTATGKGTFTLQSNTETCASGWRRALNNDYWLLDKASGGSCSSYPGHANCNGGVWGSLSGVSGRWFSGDGTKSAAGLFFPANGTGETGFSYYTGNVIMIAAFKSSCGVLTSAECDRCYTGSAAFRSDGSYPNADYPNMGGDYLHGKCKKYGGSVRCVKS